MARETRSDARVASEGPRPTMTCRFFPVAREPVPRERWIARACTMARETRSDARVASEGPSPTMKGAFYRRTPGRRAILLHRDREVSPTGTYETLSVK